MITIEDIRIQFTKESSFQYNTLKDIIPFSSSAGFKDEIIPEYVNWLESKLLEEWNQKK